jgi:hypothetical protein
VAGRPGSEPLPITSSRAAHLWDGLCRAYEVLGLDAAADGDEVLRQLVLARIIEPTSKADSLRVIEETGVAPVSYPTLNRRLPVFAKPMFRQALSTAFAAHARLGPASLVLYDVSTLHFQTDAGDGFREPGFSKERAAWTPRSRSGCSPTPPASRCRWRRLRATKPRPPPCCPACGSSWPPTSSPTSPWSPMPR